MNTKQVFTIIRLLILTMLAGSLLLSGCGSIHPTNTAIPPAQEPTSALPPTPTPDPYAIWSTDFANVTDPTARGISGWGTVQKSLSPEMANVPSGGMAVKLPARVEKAWDTMGLTFNLAGLIGMNTFDLSDKTLQLEVFMPQDSPLHYFNVDVHGLDQNNTQLWVRVQFFKPDLYPGQWHTYTADVSEDIALKVWREMPYNTSPNMTDDQAVQVLKHAQSIILTGQATKDYPPAETYFEVDSLGWAPSAPLPAYDASVDSLRKFAPAKLPVGGWNEINAASNPDFVHNFVQEFNLIATTNRFPLAEPVGDVMNYDDSWSPQAEDDILHEANGMAMLRYTGIGQNPVWIPDWLPGKSYAEVKPILEGYIRGLVEHYKGKTYIWNLFNELERYDLSYGDYTGLGLKDRNQSPPTYGNEYSPWSKDPSDLSLIEDAFRIAHETDPQALLIINDIGAQDGTAEGDALYALVAKLKADGTPIGGVGLETHILVDQDGHFKLYMNGYPVVPYDPVNGFTSIAAQVERFAALGMKVVFSETDIPIYLGDIDLSMQAGKDLLAQRRLLQAEGYRSLLHIALTHPNVVAFDVWDWQDEYTFMDPATSSDIPGYGEDMGLFNQYFQKKPSYYALLDELKAYAAAPASLPGAFTRNSPAEAAADQPLSVTLSWSPSAGATGYQYCLQASYGDYCNNWISTGTDTSVTVSVSLPGMTYFWQVRAIGPGGVVHANGGSWGTFKTASQRSFTYTQNFAGLTDLATTSSIFSGKDASGSLDTSNVHSGGKSVKMTVTLGKANPNLYMSMYLADLIGAYSYDFSDKTFSYEVYVPPDSPLSFLVVEFYSKQGEFVNVTPSGDLYTGQWHTYTVDISQFIASRPWHAKPWLIAQGMTDDNVLFNLKNAIAFAIYGSVVNPGADKVTYLLLDKVSWSGH